MILLDGGLRTRVSTFRMVAAPSLVQATVGVLLTAALVGVLAVLLLGRLLAEVVARVRVTEGLYTLLIQSGGLAIFAVTNLLQGSGFLAIFVAGTVPKL